MEELFANYGEVKSVNIIGDRGFAFVEMSSIEEAEKAKEALESKEFMGRTLRIDEARPMKEGQRRDFRESE